MKNLKKLLSAALALCIVIGTTACSSSGSNSSEATTTPVDSDKVLDTTVDWNDAADIESVDTESEAGTGELYVSGQKAGTTNALCYYDLAETQPELAELFAERFGGVIETEMTTSGSAYFEKLGTLIASGDSPDIVRYDWMAYPCGVSKNQFTALDGWLDINSEVWADEKEVIESFTYAGKHYYFPSNVNPNFAMIYDELTIQEAGLDDPLKLYDEGNWTWDTFEKICKDWANLDEENIAFTGGSWSSMMFANSTGTKVIDMTGTEIINNLRNENVQRTMDWLADMKKDGLIGDGFVEPSEAFVDGKLLFLGMGLTWGYESAQQTAFKNGIEANYVALPFPKDPNSDKYYMSADTFGFMVPAGAKNIQGGVSWILCGRIYETDPEIIAADHAEKSNTDPVYYPKCPECKYSFTDNGTDDLDTCPECNAPRKEKFTPYYSEKQLEICDAMRDTDCFAFVFDNTVGFDDTFNKLFTGDETSIFDGPLYYATSYTQLRDANYDTVESYLEPYRAALAEEVANNG